MLKVEGIDWTASYDWDLGGLGAWDAGIVGTYYLHQLSQTFPSDPILDQFHTALQPVGGIAQNGVVGSGPRMRYRARLGWSNGPWSATGCNGRPCKSSPTSQHATLARNASNACMSMPVARPMLASR